MPDNPEDDGIGFAGEPPKGRQQVRRHWKPSLGRFVHRYIRKGEHASPGDDGAEVEAASEVNLPRRSQLRRWLIISGGAVAVVIAVVVAMRLFGGRTQTIEYEVLAAREPVIVKINCGPAARIVLGSKQEKDRCVEDASRSVRDADLAHPDRLIVIDLESPRISFTSLMPAEQEELRRELGRSAGLSYETKVAALLGQIMESVDRGRVSVLGLPAERREFGFDASDRTNRCFSDVIDDIECLVSAHVFYRGDRSLAEDELVRTSLPAALHQRGDRPILFRQGKDWRVLVERGAAAAADPQATIRLVVAGE